MYIYDLGLKIINESYAINLYEQMYLKILVKKGLFKSFAVVFFFFKLHIHKVAVILMLKQLTRITRWTLCLISYCCVKSELLYYFL